MYSAIKLGQWHLNEAMRIISSGLLDQNSYNALQLIEWFKKRKIDKSKTLTKRDLLQLGPIRTRHASLRDAALKILEENKYIKIVKVGKKETIEINPFLKTQD